MFTHAKSESLRGIAVSSQKCRQNSYLVTLRSENLLQAYNLGHKYKFRAQVSTWNKPREITVCSQVQTTVISCNDTATQFLARETGGFGTGLTEIMFTHALCAGCHVTLERLFVAFKATRTLFNGLYGKLVLSH